MDIKELVRKNIRSLKPYSSARDEFSGEAGIFLDANENPYGEINRYPDPHQRRLKKAVSEIKRVKEDRIFIGNGSDEAIDLLFRVFVEPGADKVIVCPPTYGMYEVAADINNVEVVKVPLTDDFQLDIDTISVIGAKMIFLCSPNNPTGNILDNINTVLNRFGGIVVIDEAYIDFCPDKSSLSLIDKHPNLVVLQTFSKAWALAGARVGMAFAREEIIEFMDKSKPPYNVSAPNQQAALRAVAQKEEFENRRKIILRQRNYLSEELNKIDFVKKVYPSDANFLLVELADADTIYRHLVSQRIIIRNRNSQIRNCVRITVGTPEENQTLLNKLKNVSL